MGDVHVLARSVTEFAVIVFTQDFGMLLRQPRWQRIGRCSDDDMNPGLVEFIQATYEVIRIEFSVLRFEIAPCAFSHADDIEPDLLHHLYVFRQAVGRHVFVIVRNTVEQLPVGFQKSLRFRTP